MPKKHNSTSGTPGILRRIAGTFWQFWFAEAPAHALSAFRILFGVHLLWYFFRYVPHITEIFSSEGVTVPVFMPDWTLPPWLCHLVYGLFLAVIAAFTVGYRTRWTTPLTLVGFLYFFFLNLAIRNTSFDRLNIIILGILCFAELDRVWARRPKGAPVPTPTAPVWATRVITLQIAFLYFGAGLWKLARPDWLSGEMLYYTMMGPWATPLANSIVRLDVPMAAWDVATWGVIAFELLMPLGLFWRTTRPVFIVLGVGFHLSISVLLHVTEFMNCAAVYVLFCDPNTVKEVVGRVVGTVRRRPPMVVQKVAAC